MIVWLLSVLFLQAHAYPSGAPAEACSNIYPSGHGGMSQDLQDNPFALNLTDFDEIGGSVYYVPETTYNIELAGAGSVFRGFLVQARTQTAQTPAGNFTVSSSEQKLSSCPSPETAVTHTNRTDKTSVSMTWTAPTNGTGKLEFLFAVVQSYVPSEGTNTFWATAETTTLHPCEFPVYQYEENCVQTCLITMFGNHQTQQCEPFAEDFTVSTNATDYCVTVPNDTPLGTAVLNFSVVLNNAYWDSPVDRVFVQISGESTAISIFGLTASGTDSQSVENIFLSGINEKVMFSIYYSTMPPSTIEYPHEFSLTLEINVIGQSSGVFLFDSTESSASLKLILPPEIDPCTSSPCDNGGSCSASNSMTFTCTCPSGYTGTTCDVTIDECESAPCSNGGTCIDLIADFQCTCQPGYTGDTCDNITDPCDPNPCSNGGTCSEEFDSTSSCNCTSGFAGEFCTEDDPSDLFCQTTSCANGGTCNEEFGPATSCSCTSGYTGESCDEDNPNDMFCHEDSCAFGGTCNEGFGPATSCTCAGGYTGESCEEDNPGDTFCQEDSCANGGTCNEEFGPAISCTCLPGYTGNNCTMDDSTETFCTENSCVNGGTCNEEFGSATSCSCASGYTGSSCEEDNPNDIFCQEDSCAFGGTCNELFGPATSCTCASGYTGESCEEDNPDDIFCQEDSCAFGGTCNEEFGPATNCSCSAGYSGNNCAMDDPIQEFCTENSCTNGGTCNEEFGPAISCTCLPGFTGDDCTMNDPNETFCNENSCANGGTCMEAFGDSVTCACPFGFSGANCTTDISACTSDTCSNNGTCMDGLGPTIMCICPNGFTGMLCDVDIDDFCTPERCQNGGTCEEGIGSDTSCVCPRGFMGDSCTKDDPEETFCQEDSCGLGGTCIEDFGSDINCTCAQGYTGDSCTEDNPNAIFCSAITCLNGGTCIEDFGPDTSCQCTRGFMGESCSEDDPSEPFCQEEICTNGGTCEEGFGPATTCVCTPGYTGDSCEEDNPGQIFCQASSCASGGTCNELFGPATNCTCASGYTGESCDEDNPDDIFCQEDSCAFGGTCSEEFGPEFSCQCAPGYTGLDCATEIEECFEGSCLNGGTCMIHDGTVVVCLCPPHYTGSNCSINLPSCDFNMCMNDGTCVEDGLSTTCICAAGFSGSICDQDLDYCETDSCSNGGTCEEGVGTNINCTCLSGFSGYFCEIDDPFCSDDICLNGGTCVEGVGTATSCECAVGYDGERCQTELPSCVSSSCLNGGTCYEASGQEVICGCPLRFTGKQCEVAICPTELEVPVYPGSSIVYNWTQTDAGNSQTQQCPDTCQDFINYPTGATVVRSCRLTEVDAEWQDANTTGCGFDAMALQLCEASQLESDEEIAATVVNITAETSTLESSALTVSGNIIQDLTDAAIEQPEVRDNYLKIIDNVLEADMDELLESQTKSNSSTKILQGLNRFIDLVPVDNQTGNVTFTLNNFGLIAIDTGLLNQTRVQAFSANLGPVTDAISSRDTILANQLLATADPISNTTGSIEIQDLNSCPVLNSSQRVAYSVFRTDALFLTPETGCTNFTVGSIILGVRANISQECNITSVIVDMEQLQEVCSGMSLSMNRQPVCSNYDEDDINGVGRWSQDNCRRVRSSRGRTICDCSQLGHFGLLFDLNPGESLSPLALAIISYIGAILSIICLLIIVLTYVVSRSLRRNEHGKLLINMSISLICLYVIFIIAGLVTSVEALCGLVSALFQYFMLVFFGWTTAEAVNLYYKLVRVLGKPIEHYVLKAALIVWLAPILIVVISVGPGYSYYVNPYYCRATDWPFWFGLILPFGVIYIFNWVIFTIIMMKLLRRNKVMKIDIPNKVNTRVSKQNFIIAVGLSVLFGLGWGFGLTATSSNTKEVTFAFQVIFSLFVGSQGTLIFFFHGLRSPDFRQLWQSILCLFKKKKYAVSSREQRKTNSSYNTATLNKTGSLPLHSDPMFHSNTENFSSDSLSGHDTLLSTKGDVTFFQEDVDEKTDLGMEEVEGQNQSVGETATVIINAGRATDIPETCGEEEDVPTLKDAESEIPAKA